jgi:hypothetical protein
MNSGSGGGVLASTTGYLKDPGFWVSVVVVNLVVSFGLVLLGAPGFKR